MNIVGINIGHDVSVCLMRHGKIIFYLEEERLNKIKSYDIKDLRMPIQTLKKIKKYTSHIDYLIFTSYGRDPPNFAEDKINYDIVIAELVMNQLLNLKILVDKFIVDFENHHLFHAYNAFYFSGFKSAVSLIMDGSGSYNLHLSKSHLVKEIESIYKFDNNNHEKLFKHYTTFTIDNFQKDIDFKFIDGTKDILTSAESAANLYWWVTHLIGFGVNNEGKVMGMSSYGDLDKKETEWIIKHNNNYLLNYKHLRNRNLLSAYKGAYFNEQADLAKKVQYETQQYTFYLIQKAIDLSDSNNIVLSGGYFQNCVNNYAYLKKFPNINFYVDPICYDGGTSIGACLYVWHHILGNPNTLQKLDNLYLGPE